VNVTLLFAQDAYEQVAAAYLGGLESLARQGGNLGKVASVASFFISRIDTAVDNWLVGRVSTSHPHEEQARLRSLLGKVANASATLTYRKYLEIVHGDRWQELSRQGAQTQRLLWASTGTKNPAYRDVVYVEELIGPDTVNTMPPATLAAFRDHGRVRPTLTENVETAISIMDLAAEVGVPFKEITGKLVNDGVKQFAEAFDKLLQATDRGGRGAHRDSMDYLKIKLIKELENAKRHF